MAEGGGVLRDVSPKTKQRWGCLCVALSVTLLSAQELGALKCSPEPLFFTRELPRGKGLSEVRLALPPIVGITGASPDGGCTLSAPCSPPECSPGQMCAGVGWGGEAPPGRGGDRGPAPPVGPTTATEIPDLLKMQQTH